MARTIVVIGGAGGGAAAAVRAREVDESARIVLVEKKARVSFVQAGLRYRLEAGATAPHTETRTDEKAFFDRHRVEVRTSTECVRIDPESKRAVLESKTGNDAIRFDAAIFSGGAEMMRPDVDGLEHAPGFRSADDLAAIVKKKPAAPGGARAVVLGAGPYGIDAAYGLRAAGFDVEIIERAQRVLPSLSLLGARAAERSLRADLPVHLGDEVLSARPLGERTALTTRGGKKIDADLVVVATGLRPSTDLLSEAGASLNGDGSVRTAPDMQTTLPGVYACGTAVSVVHAVTRAPLWIPQAAIATRTSQVAGKNAADAKNPALLPPLAGSALYRVSDRRFGRTGLSETEARALLTDERIVVITIHGYAGEPWVGGDELCVRLVVDRKAESVVGGEVWGKEGVPRRLDLLSIAVEQAWSPGKLADVDIAYSPTLGPAIDPLHIAARVAAETLHGEARPISAESLALRVMKREPMQIVDVGDVQQGPHQVAWPDGTRALPLEKLREGLDSLPRDRPIVLVSRTGQRAYQAYRVLAQRGFDNAVHLDGGWLSYALMID
ncbi:MAG TPA: FAD-dependent oxidoreductase [Myxococcota bacterium]|jgi:NADPH-dependent 2,4-dienoyl-CoA reductase/sulfur reductase-like enzyme/rhodanese-related sulfurtransferase